MQASAASLAVRFLCSGKDSEITLTSHIYQGVWSRYQSRLRRFADRQSPWYCQQACGYCSILPASLVVSPSCTSSNRPQCSIFVGTLLMIRRYHVENFNRARCACDFQHCLHSCLHFCRQPSLLYEACPEKPFSVNDRLTVPALVSLSLCLIV